MGYSNVTGDLNVQSTITSQNVYVFGSTTLNSLTTNDGVTLNGSLSVPGNSTFGKITTANLTVTGNFTVTTTNTAFSNALSVNNSGTATALKVVQFESGGGAHTYNVAEFWDYQTLAMVIDPQGNVGIHTKNTGTFGLSVADGANVDSLQALTVSTGILSTPLANVTTLNVGTLANLNLVNVYSELTSTIIRVGNAFIQNLNVTTTNSLTYVTTNNLYADNAIQTTNIIVLNNVYAANALQTTNVFAVRGNVTYMVATNNVYAANALQTTNVLTTTLIASNNLYASNALFTTNVLATTANATYIIAMNNVYAANSIQTTNVYATTTNVTTGNASTFIALNNVFAANSIQTTNVYATTSNLTTGNATYLVALNNVFAANALQTTNVLATTANLTTGNATYLVALNNVYAANALQTTNVLATFMSLTNNVYAANALQTTNVLATTANLTTGNASTFTALNNVFAANSIQTTNVYASTTNVTTGNASTFIALNNVFAANSIQTTNVYASTINTTTLNIISEVATNNVFAANALFTTNVIATTANLTTGNATYLVALNNVFAANAVQTTNLISTGNTSISNMKVQSFNFSVASGAGSYTNVCSLVDSPNGSGIYAISAEMMSRGAGGTAMTKTYIFPCNYNATAGVWTRVIPFSIPSGYNQIGLDALTSGGTTILRATNLGANEVVNVGIVLRVSSSSFSSVVINNLTTQSDVGATSTGFYPTSVYTQNNGLIGITTENPTSNLHVVGNIYASNSLQTTNVYAVTSNVTTDNATYMIARNNVYAANALQTTNVLATTANLTTGNATYLVALNNVYAANSIFTTNVYATTTNLTTGNATFLVASNNVYAANAVFTTNVFATTANVGTLNVWQVSNIANLTVSNSIASTNNWISGVSKISGTNLPGYMSGIVRYEYSYSTGSMGNQSQIDTLLQGSTQTSNTLVLTTINQASTPFLTANFVWVYIGTIYVSVTGSYTFVTNSDDASDVFIDYPGAMDPRYTTGNATPITTYYGTHGTGGGGTPGTVTLAVGFHTVMYRLVQGGGGYGAALLWTPPAGISAAIPSTNYFYQTTGRSNLATNSTLEITGDSGASNTALLINSSNVGISVQSGNVGIGTTVPLAPLHIYGTSAVMRLQQSAYPVTGASGDPGIQFSDPNGTVRSYIQYANGSGFLYVGNQLRVYDVGYVLVNYGIVVNNGPFNNHTLTSALSVQGNTYMNGTLQAGSRTYSNLLANSLVNENLFLTKQSLASRNDWGVVSNVQGATITYAGSPYKDANVSAGSAYLSATTYINVASTTSNTNFDWTSSNTCIEAWIWSTNLGATTYIANRGTDFSFYLGGVQLAFSYNGNTYNSGIYLNSQYYQWVHVLFQYDASTSRIYLGVNGTMVNTTKLTSVYTSTLPFYIGSYPVAPLTTAACAISDLRIVRGSTVLPYGTGTTYTVPTGPVGTYSSGTTPLLWPNVNVPAGVVSASQIGIGTSLPNSNLEVYGNAYISNALTTTNVFATGQVGIGTTGFFTGTSGLTVYTAANQISAAFFDRTNQGLFIVPNTGGNGYYFGFSKANDVLIVPSYNSLSIGIQASPNLGIGMRMGNQAEAGGGSVTLYANTQFMAVTNSGVGIGTTSPSANLHIVGNVYASNALTTTNIFAASEVLTGISGITTFNVTGNIYASNSVTTTNVFVSGGFYGPIVGSNTVASTVVTASSNVNAPTINVTTMNAATSIATTGFYGPVVGSNVIGATVITASSNVNAPTINATTSNSATSIATTGFYGPVVGSNVIGATVITASSNVNAPTINATTSNSATSIATTGFYGPVVGSNVIGATVITASSNVNAPTINATTSNSATSIATTGFYGPVVGSNVIGATVITASSNVNAPTINATTMNTATSIATTGFYGPVVGSNVVGATVITASSNVNAPTINATTSNSVTAIATTGFYGPVVGSNVIGATVITASSNVNAPTINATTSNSVTAIATTGFYGPVVGSNVIGATVITASSNVNAPTINATTMNTATSIATTGFYGPVVGSNVIGATVITASSNVNAPTINATTSNSVTAIATTGFYGPVVGSNVIGATVITASSNVNAPTINVTTMNAATSITTTGFYGPVVGSNVVGATVITASSNVNAPTINATTSNSVTAIATTGFYGPVVGSNVIGATVITASSNVNAPTINVTTMNAATSITTTGFYGPVVGSNVVGATVITASSNVNAPTINATTSNSATVIATTGFYGPIVGSNTIAGSSLTLGTALSINNGGTGQTIASAGFDALSPMTTLGDFVYGGASGTGTRLAPNSTGTLKFLSETSSTPSWVTISATDLPVVTFSPGSSGTYGSSTAIPVVTIDTYGRITGVTTQPATGLSGLTTYGVLYASSSSGVTTTATGSSGQPLLSGGVAAGPSYGTLGLSYGGTGQTTKSAAFDALSPMTTLGDLIYGGASGSNSRLVGSTSATQAFLTQTGNGTVSGAPSWVTSLPLNQFSGLVSGGVAYGSATTTIATNSAGTSGQALLSGGAGAPTWGTLGLSYGGTGQTTKSAAFDALSPMTTLGDLIYGGASGSNSRLVGNTTATKNFLVQTGNGTVSGAPIWGTILAGDVPTLNQNTTGTAGGLTGTPNITVGTVNAGAITSSQVALVGFKNIVNRQPLIGIGAFGAAMYFSTTSTSTYTTPLIGNIVYGPFSSSYGAGSVATGATRQYRMYAVWSDNIQATASSFQIIFNMANSTTITFSFGITNGDPANYRDGYSDTQTISNTNNASTISFSIPNGVTGKATGGTNLSTANIRINYLELQAIDQY